MRDKECEDLLTSQVLLPMRINHREHTLENESPSLALACVSVSLLSCILAPMPLPQLTASFFLVKWILHEDGVNFLTACSFDRLSRDERETERERERERSVVEREASEGKMDQELCLKHFKKEEAVQSLS